MQKIEINKENPSVLLCCYGTLLEGFGNYNALLKGRSTYLGTYETKPEYEMYSTGGFPIVTSGEHSIEIDVFEITDNETLQQVHRLEGCTGIPNDPRNWYNITNIETPHGLGWIYMQETGRGLPIVKTRKWRTRNAS